MIAYVELTRALRAPPAARRRAVAGLVAAGVVAVFGLLLWRARVQLDDRRDELAEARAELRSTRDDLDRTRHRTELTGDGIDLVRSEVTAAVDARTWTDALSRNTLVEIAEVDAARVQADVEILLVAANSGETQACFEGVSRAVDANRQGDEGTAVDALGDAAGPCTRTLALATGARFPYDFADPYVLRAGGAYYGYSTNAGLGDIQVIRSTDLVAWELVGNGLAALPGWAMPNATWAPSVVERDGRYVMYYTVREAATWLQCTSRAVSSSPTGPFLDDSTGPMVCQREDGGSIDPSPFVDADGRAYLLWKAEGLGPSDAPATLWGRELRPDGLGFVGNPKPLLAADRGFERGTVEGPTMLRAPDGTYVLLYAAAGWSSGGYATAYATCAGPLGPCTKPDDGRILRSDARIAGPGGAEVFLDARGSPWVAFHAYSEPNVGYPSSRYLHIAPLRFTGSRPSVDATP